MRIVFMGTPDIAVTALDALLAAGHDIAAVYTREDKPVGRKRVITAPPVKVRAMQHNIPVHQPKTMRTASAAEELAALKPELVVVVAYGRILPKDVLNVPKHGCINLHVSLLPKYRGAAPIQWAIINGERETGVSIMQMDEGLDTGPVLAQERVEIKPSATAGEVFEEVAQVGACLLRITIERIQAGEIKPIPQEGEASHAPPLTKDVAGVDFARPACDINSLVCGCNPWPLAWFDYEGKRIKVLQSTLVHTESGNAGEILAIKPLTIACGDGAIVLENVLPEGGKAITGAQWALGRRFKIGDVVQLCGE